MAPKQIVKHNCAFSVQCPRISTFTNVLFFFFSILDLFAPLASLWNSYLSFHFHEFRCWKKYENRVHWIRNRQENKYIFWTLSNGKSRPIAIRSRCATCTHAARTTCIFDENPFRQLTTTDRLALRACYGEHWVMTCLY